MYVEWESPADAPTPGPPWVLIHGGGGQGTDYLTTPDGRLGWSRLLVQQGHTVYVVDRPGHGRSPHHPDILGPMGPQMGAARLRPIFVPPARGPDSNLGGTCTRSGRAGANRATVLRPVAGAVGPMLASWHDMHALEQVRLAELLEQVGPAVLVTHSAGGPGTFLAADARPDQVAALIAIERGPLTSGAPGGPAAPAARPEPVPDCGSDRGGVDVRHVRRHLVAFLEQCGCDVESMRWPTMACTATAHGIMIERNNADALAVYITRWVARKTG